MYSTPLRETEGRVKGRHSTLSLVQCTPARVVDIISRDRASRVKFCHFHSKSIRYFQSPLLFGQGKSRETQSNSSHSPTLLTAMAPVRAIAAAIARRASRIDLFRVHRLFSPTQSAAFNYAGIWLQPTWQPPTFFRPSAKRRIEGLGQESTSAAAERFHYATAGRYKVEGVGRGVAKLLIGLLGVSVTAVSARWFMDR